MIVNILGTDYEIIKRTKCEDPKLEDCWGYTEPFTKKIIIDANMDDGSKLNAERLDLFEKKVMRHEIIHAFFIESGLHTNCDYAGNEELVDWIALQFPKIAKVIEQVKGDAKWP